MIFIHILYGRCVVFSNQFGLKLVISAIFLLQKNQFEEKPRDHKITKSSSCKIKVCSYYKHKLYYKSPSVISLMIAFLLHARSMQELSLFNIKINIIFASCYRTFQINGAKMQFCGAKFVYLYYIIMAILMKGPTIFRRTTKSEGIIKLRFRLRDGRDVDLYHKSEIKADLKT